MEMGQTLYLLIVVCAGSDLNLVTNTYILPSTKIECETKG